MLSPVLFHVYTEDLSADQKNLVHSMTILSLSLQRQQQQKNDVTPLNESKFADDHHLWRTSSNISDLKSCLQSDLKMINCWCHKWRINLNLKMTNVLLFNGKHGKIRENIH